ncbi:diguanylate cyclase (GGDEF)-like protein [Novosphingobium sp. PhB57]|uniref:putative bifunctional diguanylate cyclase/phosphodiesterase n=1 Tax=unclassified Novosphingobium TaxID=2644732 RepID=UPI0010CF3B14|nr:MULTISPECIES: EAL domain-containing protein [unclassified Novosphingobium]TCU61730.1 diguanylate cyclase (GGDEF)-like protein [Novosphingobium sp. PhB57]TDW68798.1 diguanylate cyclase (GGDEF)-like protein [Novosphingobium sp. PhB55]
MPDANVIEYKMHRAGHYPLPVAQYLRLRERIPPLYGLLSVNAAILAYTHRALAPGFLTLTIPAVLIACCLIRMLVWLRPIGQRDLEADVALRRMRRAIWLALVFAMAFAVWSLCLDRYGGPYEHGHVAVFVSVTVLGCVFCLTFLPTAALLICLTALGMFLVYCVTTGSATLTAVAINIALVAAVILKILRDTYDSFVELEVAQRDLRAERRQAQALGDENARLAQTDALTGLPNRRYFFATLENLLESGEDRVFCVGLIDLDRFKPVNDTYGHAQGDRLLQVIGTRLIAQCDPSVTIARLGGDEFGFIVPGGPDEAEAIAQKFCAAIRSPARIGEVTMAVGGSAGIAIYPESARTAHSLYDRADFALYHAKNHRRGQCVRFSDHLETLIRSEQALDAAMQSADLSRELSVAYQPIIATESNQPVGFECLARWTSPTLGVIAPEMMIAAAERVGRAREVTATLFDHALDTLARLPHPISVSFNLSGHDISDAETIGTLLERIETSGSDARRLLFEITETTLIAELDTARIVLERLRATGARIALDDFGTGYSSLSSLHQLPLDMVKIDRSFAPRLDETVGRRLISAIRNLARALSLECVIEGIETEDQLLSARIAGFSLAQGFHIARPMSLDDMLARIETSSKTWHMA